MIKFKALIYLMLVPAMLLIMLAGCSANTKTPEDTPETVAPDTPIEPTTDIAPSYRDVFDENGYFKGIKALEFVEMFNYKAIKIPKEKHTVTEEEIQAEVDYMMAELSENNKIFDRPVADGDRVNMDFSGTVDGIKFDGGSTNGAGTDATIGVDAYIEGFLEQLIGHMPGDSFDIKVKFPADYVEESLKGKDAVFATTINYIVDMRLNDHYVMANLSETYGWTTADELLASLRSDMEQYKIKEYVNEYLSTQVTVKSVPDEIVEYQKNAMINFYQEYADYNGVKLDDVISYEGYSNIDELVESYQEVNYENALNLLVILAIAEDEDFLVSEEDVADYFLTYNNSTNTSMDYSSYAQQYGWPYLRHNAMCKKVVDYLIDNAVLL